VYPPSLWRKDPRKGIETKEIEGISCGNATELQRDDNGRKWVVDGGEWLPVLLVQAGQSQRAGTESIGG
jgi:hypothetical protein